MRFFCSYSTNIKIRIPLYLPNPPRVKDQRETKDGIIVRALGRDKNQGTTYQLPTTKKVLLLRFHCSTVSRLACLVSLCTSPTGSALAAIPASKFLPFLCLLSSGVPDNTPRLLFVYYLECIVLLASSPISYSPQGVL